MPQIDIPQDLFQQVDQTRPRSVSTAEFVAQAVREKLDRDDRMTRLDELTGRIRRSMLEHGVTEEEVLTDFEAHRDAACG
jgi:hypothetical protein